MSAAPTVSLPGAPADVTVDWMTAALGLDAGALRGVEVELLGDGFVGDVLRVRLDAVPGARLPDGSSLPASVVVKLPTANEALRAAARNLHLYERELYFYDRVRPRLGAGIPACYQTIAGGDGVGVVVLEDLPARPTNLLDPCSPETAARVLATAAELHATAWGRAEARDLLEGVPGGSDPQSIVNTTFLESVLPAFEQLCGGQLTPRQLDVARALPARLAGLQQAVADRGPRTLVHADLRFGNVLLGGAEEVYVVDWQTLGHNLGAADVAYFLTSSLDVDVRRDHERALLERYLGALARHGVTDYAYERLADDFRDCTLLACAVAITTKVTVQGSTDERAGAGLDRWIERVFTAVVDLGADEMLLG